MLKKENTISVVGLGKLGLCLSCCFAEKGFKVIGVDINEEVIKRVNKAIAPWHEPQLDEFLARHGGKNLIATSIHSEAIEKSDITILLVATPSMPDGSFSNRIIESAFLSLAKALKQSKKEHHIFVISSTVMPESTNNVFIPLLEKQTGRKLNEGFSVCYDPDFVALGNVIKGFLNPDLVVIGESSVDAGEIIQSLHKQICENDTPIFRMSIINAELAKVCLNAYITTKISFANSIANLCEKVPGADVDSITTAIGVDKRISPYYFQGGTSFGGTCFPRDIKAYLSMANKYSVQSDIIQAVDKVNKLQNDILLKKTMNEIKKSDNKTVGILGLAFTSKTPVITESPSIKLIEGLLEHGLKVIAYDKYAKENSKVIFGTKIEYASDPSEVLSKSSVVVFTIRDAYLKESIETFSFTSQISIIDCWRILDEKKLTCNVRYIPIGKHLTV